MEVTGSKHSQSDPDQWEVTSVKMRRSTKRAVKIYAAEHDITMQSVLEEALLRLLAGEK